MAIPSKYKYIERFANGIATGRTAPSSRNADDLWLLLRDFQWDKNVQVPERLDFVAGQLRSMLMAGQRLDKTPPGMRQYAKELVLLMRQEGYKSTRIKIKISTKVGLGILQRIHRLRRISEKPFMFTSRFGWRGADWSMFIDLIDEVEYLMPREFPQARNKIGMAGRLARRHFPTPGDVEAQQRTMQVIRKNLNEAVLLLRQGKSTRLKRFVVKRAVY